MTVSGSTAMLRPRIPPVTPLGLFVTAVCLVALPLLAWSLGALFVQPTAYGVNRLVIVLLVLGVVLGEMVQVEVALRDAGAAALTLSTTFTLALIFVAPLGLVVLAQAIPLVVDDVKRGKHWSRPVFNLAQYVISAAAARGTFSLIAGQEFFTPRDFASSEVGAAMVASLVYLLVNMGLVVTVIALAGRQLQLSRLWADLRQQFTTAGPMVAMAPVFLAVTDFSLWLLPLLLIPIAAVQAISRLALEHRDSARHDPLTKLPNRSYFLLQLDQTLAARPSGANPVAVMFIDLDHFKEINDTLGHEAGDSLIRDIGHRLRSAATAEVTVARLGGDEFAVLTELPAGEQPPLAQAIALAERLGSTLDEPVSVAGVRLEVRASIGIALAPQHAQGSADLLAKADIAMYLAKGNGGGVAVYDPSKDENTTERLVLLTELHDALGRPDSDQLTVYYQPKCDTHTGQVVGAEALVRWRHPERGLLGAEKFIPVAETAELITQLTLVVLEQAIRQARVWLDQGRWLGVAVNLSVRHLADVRLPEQVNEMLTRHRVPPALLTLEVTENTVMTDPHRAVAVLAMLRAGGVKIAIDDYGTGYSSLAYLKRLSVDELKIDRSFIIGMTSDDNNQIIVKSTIELGHNLGLRLVAEGVEDAETWRHLQTLGCDVIQGFTAQPPLPAPEFDDWLRRWDADQREAAIVDLRLRPPATTSELVAAAPATSAPSAARPPKVTPATTAAKTRPSSSSRHARPARQTGKPA
ncbi:putative bifunctional diguanylate cyclase/phosphodiesterase [Kineosporia babensis]|uniref:Bifunctional diguanylate cyclase/phosphodiesterase n=1 Tax=Kineosporia babensis TaxID=499548 RepID=A0A9X1NIM9_9ACTN|nr:bifunctional diguanylate cyclase/phosphodiesterase [Kineosporia babensis]MCD5314519.1 bifunctional diguanylate cyclase/phosphodiesterase [Kineosporia babensis]